MQNISLYQLKKVFIRVRKMVYNPEFAWKSLMPKGWKDKRQKEIWGKNRRKVFDEILRWRINKTIKCGPEGDEIHLGVLTPSDKVKILSKFYRGMALTSEETRIVSELSFSISEIQKITGFGSWHTVAKHIKALHKSGWLLKNGQKYVFNESGSLFKLYYASGNHEKVLEMEDRILKLASSLKKSENINLKMGMFMELKKTIDHALLNPRN